MTLTRILIVGLLLLAFGAGYFIGVRSEENIAALEFQVEELSGRNVILAERNAELKETLGIVRRQIETDRVGYADMRKAIERADQERAAMLEKFEAQKELLERLKKSLNN